MSETMACASCRALRAPADLITVTDRRTGRRRYVCRPTLDTPCFRIVARSAVLDLIAPAGRALPA